MRAAERSGDPVAFAAAARSGAALVPGIEAEVAALLAGAVAERFLTSLVVHSDAPRGMPPGSSCQAANPFSSRCV
jgi:hypothetical protein